MILESGRSRRPALAVEVMNVGFFTRAVQADGRGETDGGGERGDSRTLSGSYANRNEEGTTRRASRRKSSKPTKKEKQMTEKEAERDA